MIATPFRLPATAAVLAVCLASVAHAQRPSVPDPDDFEIVVDLERLPVISQDSTGTCWSFATTSFLESEVKRLSGEQIDLSEMFLVRWAYMEKAERYVRLHGKTQFSQGGLSHDVIAMARRYGIVPAADFDGLAGNATRHDHGELEKTLKAMLEVYAPASSPSPYWQDAIGGVLDAYLGEVPEVIEVEGRKMTPQQYAAEVLRLPLDDYVEIMSLQSEGFGRRSELLVPDNWMRDANYWNVPVDDLLANLDHALEHGYTVAIDCDVSEPTNDNRRGVYQLSPALERRSITDELRQQQFDSRETTDDHLMHIVGIAKADDGRTFYITKNSWGRRGPFEGNLMLSRNYVALKTLALMVHVDGLTSAVRERFGRPAGQ